MKEIVEGINAAHQNSLRPAEDTERLLESGSFATATSLSILSLEEAGKASILRHMSTADEDRRKKLWKEYRSHTSKNYLTIVSDLIHQGGRKLLDFASCFSDSGLKDRELFDALKQVGFYTDCLGNRHWSIPSVVVTEQVAKAFVRDAMIFARQESVTVREMELWQFHLGVEESLDSICAWAKAMELEGLKQKGFSLQFSTFVK